MESNNVGGIFVVWRMSIASKRAKERQKRTPDELAMGKTVKLGTLKLGGAVLPLVRAVVPLEVLSGSTARRGGSTLVSGFFADRLGAQFWGGNG